MKSQPLKKLSSTTLATWVHRKCSKEIPAFNREISLIYTSFFSQLHLFPVCCYLYFSIYDFTLVFFILFTRRTWWFINHFIHPLSPLKHCKANTAAVVVIGTALSLFSMSTECTKQRIFNKSWELYVFKMECIQSPCAAFKGVQTFRLMLSCHS